MGNHPSFTSFLTVFISALWQAELAHWHWKSNCVLQDPTIPAPNSLDCWIINHLYLSVIHNVVDPVAMNYKKCQKETLPNFGLLCPRIWICTAQQYSTNAGPLVSLWFRCKRCHFLDVILLFRRNPSQFHNYGLVTLCPMRPSFA